MLQLDAHTGDTDPLFFWKSWCQARRTQTTRDLIASLRRQCDQECAEALEPYYEAVAATYGTQGTECSWRAGHARAVKGSALCARHLDWVTDDGAIHADFDGRSARYTDRLLTPPRRPDA